MRWAAVVMAGLLAAGMAWCGEESFKESFEAKQPVWVRGGSDAAPTEVAHEVTTKTAHSGQQSERIQVKAEQGTYIHYVYSVGRLELEEKLQLSVWVKANRPGTQLCARLVLPKERDPNNLEQALTVILRGESFNLPGRWQPLVLSDVLVAAKEQKQLLHAEQKRAVNFDGAYIDQLILNIYGGKGVNEVWIDDLEISPLPGKQFVPAKPAKAPGVVVSNPGDPVKKPGQEMIVEMNLDRLTVNKKPFFVRAIRHSDTPLKTLRDAGFNTLWLDYDARDEVMEAAINRGFWLAPHIPVLEDNQRVSIPDGLTRELKRFKHKDAVLFWHAGSGLTAEHAATVGKAARVLHSDPEIDRPVAGDIWDGFKPYSRHLDMLGIHRWPLGTGLELAQYRTWLTQRTRLAEPGKYEMTWIQTHLPDWQLNLVYETNGQQGFNEPIGPHPEQIRLMTYLAISSGYKGIGYWSDRFLANSHHGRDRLLQLGLLNQELEMLEPMLATAKVVDWIGTSHPEVKAAVLRYEGGMIVLPIWLGGGAQFCPGQFAVNNLTILIPGAPEDADPFEISPGRIVEVKAARAPGGLRVTLPEFGLTAAVLLTGDRQLIGDLQTNAKAGCMKAAQWSYDLALEQLMKVEYVNDRLEQMGQAQPDGGKLLQECRKRLNNAYEAWGRGTISDYRDCYAESQRALRPLRILMRAHWERAVKVIDLPVSSPYAVSFYTLPRHWQFVDEIRGAKEAANLLAEGDIEQMPVQGPGGWALQQDKLDAVILSAGRTTEQPQQGKHCLKLEVRPEDPLRPPAALERTFLAVTTPTVRAHPGSIVRVSGWVRIPEAIQGSADGVLLFDNIGGEPLAVRLAGVTPWQKFTLYRRVPASGTVNLTVALTGIGAAYFDDLRIEPLFPADSVKKAKSDR